MRIGDYAKEEWELVELARMGETGLGQLILRVIAQREQEAIAEARKRMRIGTVDVRKDMVYGFGFADGIAWLKELPGAAMDQLNRQKRRETTQ